MSTSWPILLFRKETFSKEIEGARKNARTLVFHLREKGKRGDKANRVKQKTTKQKHWLSQKTKSKRAREREQQLDQCTTKFAKSSPPRKRHESKEQQSRARSNDSLSAWFLVENNGLPKMTTCPRFSPCFRRLTAIGSNPEEKGNLINK